MEYIKLYWKHNEKDTDPVAILYEVDIEEDRYAVRLINIFADRHTENQEDPAWGWVTEAPVPAAEEFNSYEYGEEFKAHLITKEHFEAIIKDTALQSLFCRTISVPLYKLLRLPLNKFQSFYR